MSEVITKKESLSKYHASKPISKSRLFEMSVSPEWFHYRETHRQPPTEAMLFGSAFHKLVLEPRGFFREFAVAPDCDRRTKEGKEAYSNFIGSIKTKTAISQDMWALALNMREKIRSNKYASGLLSGSVEVSYYLQDDLTGIKWKARPDVTRMLRTTGVIVDLKSCNHADTDSFMRDCIKYGYDLQAAMFKEAVERRTGVRHDFVFVAIEKEPPHLINILQADEFMLKRGGELFREYMGMYANCLNTDVWYGYNGFSGAINNLSLPAWLVKEYE